MKFLRDYDYTPSGDRRVTYAYFEGETATVKSECGLAAIAAGAAERAPAPKRADAQRG